MSLEQDIKTRAFIAGYKELYSAMNTSQINHGWCFSKELGNGTPIIWFKSIKDWALAQTLKAQIANLGFSPKIQKQYTLPAKKKGAVIYKKYKGLNWEKYGSLDWSCAEIEIAQYPRRHRGKS